MIILNLKNLDCLFNDSINNMKNSGYTYSYSNLVNISQNSHLLIYNSNLPNLPIHCILTFLHQIIFKSSSPPIRRQFLTRSLLLLLFPLKFTYFTNSHKHSLY